jgi:hypothetical protein
VDPVISSRTLLGVATLRVPELDTRSRSRGERLARAAVRLTVGAVGRTNALESRGGASSRNRRDNKGLQRVTESTL